MKKNIILSMFIILTLTPVFASDNVIARSDAGRIINRIFNDNQRDNYYNRYDSNSNQDYRRSNRGNKKYQVNGRYNNNRNQRKYSRYEK